MYAVVEFVKDKGTESYNIVMGEDTPEYKVNKQLGTPVSNAIEIYQLSVKISELICGDVTELPERIFDNSQYVTLIFNEINKEMLPEFKEGEEYVMMLGILREDSDIREKYVNNPEIFPGEIYYITDQNNILSTQDYRNEYSGLKLMNLKKFYQHHVKASDEVAKLLSARQHWQDRNQTNSHTVKTGTTSIPPKRYYLDGSWYVSTGYTYRLTFTVTVYKTCYETVSGYYEAELS